MVLAYDGFLVVSGKRAMFAGDTIPERRHLSISDKNEQICPYCKITEIVTKYFVAISPALSGRSVQRWPKLPSVVGSVPGRGRQSCWGS